MNKELRNKIRELEEKIDSQRKTIDRAHSSIDILYLLISQGLGLQHRTIPASRYWEEEKTTLQEEGYVLLGGLETGNELWGRHKKDTPKDG